MIQNSSNWPIILFSYGIILFVNRRDISIFKLVCKLSSAIHKFRQISELSFQIFAGIIYSGVAFFGSNLSRCVYISSIDTEVNSNILEGLKLPIILLALGCKLYLVTTVTIGSSMPSVDNKFNSALPISMEP